MRSEYDKTLQEKQKVTPEGKIYLWNLSMFAFAIMVTVTLTLSNHFSTRKFNKDIQEELFLFIRTGSVANI